MTTVTLFENDRDVGSHEYSGDLHALLRDAPAHRLNGGNCPLPLFSVERYGTTRRRKAIRNSANVVAITGFCIDHDSGNLSIAEAAERLRDAGIRAVLYTTRRHTAERPRWRAVLEYRNEISGTTAAMGSERRRHVAYMEEKVLGPGVIAPESADLSRGWYYGWNEHAPERELVVVEGKHLDEIIPADLNGAQSTPPERMVKPRVKARVSCTAYGAAALDSACENVANASEGTRNTTLNREAFGMGQLVTRGDVVEEEALSRLGAAAHRCGLDQAEIDKTMPHALQDGKQAPRDDARAKLREQAHAIGEGSEVDPAPAVMTTDAMLRDLVFLTDGSRVARRSGPRWPMPLTEARNWLRASITRTETKTRSAIEDWLASPGRLTVDSLTFAPGAGEFCRDPAGRACLNAWQPYQREAGDPIYASLLLDHIAYLFGDRANDFLDWLAHIEQKPGELPHRAWLHIAIHHGVGRNLLACALARVWHGHTALGLDLPSILDSGFNGQLAGKLLGIVDELREGSPTRAEQHHRAQTLKRLVTESTRTVNPKYGRQHVETNAMRWLFYSNHYDAIPIERADRRIEVVSTHAKPRGDAYYTKLAANVQDTNAINGFVEFLRRRDLRAFNPGGHAQGSAAKRAASEATQSPILRDLCEYLDQYPKQWLFAADEVARATGLVPVGRDASVFARAAAEAGLVKVKGRKVLSDGTPSVLYCRRQAAEAMNRWTGRRLPPRNCPRAQGRI